MAMTPEEKAARKRDRMIAKAREFTLGTYSTKYVAPIYQRMIRAESAAEPDGDVCAVVKGELARVPRRRGQCVCVTCGLVGPWKGNSMGGGPIETGHFITGRTAAVLYADGNAHPQCVHCNQHLGGNPANYELWMQHVYGPKATDALRRLRHTTRKFTREELVDMKLEFTERLKMAEVAINST